MNTRLGWKSRKNREDTRLLKNGNRRRKESVPELKKTPTGIAGLDEITGGGLPKGRPTLVCGAAGCGKTLLAMEFLVRGAREYGEPGVFVSFEENEKELTQNVASLGFDLRKLTGQKKILLDHIRIQRNEIEETGEYNLEGLFVRLGYAIDSIGAKRVVLDTIEALFVELPNQPILRAELRRLFRWLKDKGVTAVITAERGEKTLTRHGLEEYVADCVIVLDHRVVEQLSIRRLRILKYRGSAHGTNEYPFLIDKTGISVLPITSLGLNHPVSSQRVSTGIAGLDAMLEGKGYYRGSSVLISGTAGTGKTSLVSAFARASCRRGDRCLWFSHEESEHQMVRNMRSIGIDLAPALDNGSLRLLTTRPTTHGLEMHLVKVHDEIGRWKPRTVIMDPVSSLTTIGLTYEVTSMLTRLIDFLKEQNITAVFTSLTSAQGPAEQTQVGISSLMDTWIALRNLERNNGLTRALTILKSRGMAHSLEVRELCMTDRGIEFRNGDREPGPGLKTMASLNRDRSERLQNFPTESEMGRGQTAKQSDGK